MMEETAQTRVISLFNPITGRGPVVLRSDQIRWSAGISPDGRHIALVFPPEQERFIRIIDLHGVTERDIAVTGAHYLTGLDWTADGSGFFAQDEDGHGGRLLHVDLNGASQVVLSGKAYGIASPDGRHVALGRQTIVGNVWMVENP
jgi:Tol biopolymer transport system component